MELLQSLSGSPENEQLSIFDLLAKVERPCSNCADPLSDDYHQEAEGETGCRICAGSRYKTPADPDSLPFSVPQLTLYFKELQPDDFLFYDFGFRAFQYNAERVSDVDAAEVDFANFYRRYTKKYRPKHLLKRIRSKIVEDFMVHFHEVIQHNYYGTNSAAEPFANIYRALLFFKEFVDGTAPGTFRLTSIKMAKRTNFWTGLGVCLKAAVPEETLLADFFYYACQATGADARRAIKTYRANEIMEPIIKMSFSKDKWMDERRKKLSYLLKDKTDVNDEA